MGVLLVALLVAGCSSGVETISPKPTAVNKECSTADLVYSVGATEGAAGTSFTELIFENVSGKICNLGGFLTAQPVFGVEKTPVGPPSQLNEVEGNSEFFSLAPSKTAALTFAVATASNFEPADCEETTSDGVVINTAVDRNPLLVRFDLPPYSVCTKLENTFIYRFHTM